MKIKFNFKDDKSNPTNQVKAFIQHVLASVDLNKNQVEVLSPEQELGKGADYFVSDVGLLIEATYLIDRKDLAESARWGITVNTLSKLIKEHKKFSSIKGFYSILTPETFGLKAAQLKNESLLNTKISDAVNKIIEAILSDNTDVQIFGYKLRVEKINEADNGVYFSTIGKAGSINVPGVFHRNLKNKFKKANVQLSLKKINEIKVKKRILLIVNKYRLLAFDWDLFEGLSYSYKELTKKYKNIDEIWFQVEDKQGKYHHKLLYKRPLFKQIENKNFSTMNSQDYKIFAKWFSSLEKLSDKKKKELIESLKIMLKNQSPYKIFPDPQTRIEMVRYGRWLAENGKKAEANWLVQQFMDDPDPHDPPTKDKKDYGNQLHFEVKNADKPNIHAIHTIRGHLAWTVQLLALKKDKFLLESYDYTQHVLRNTQHLYLILQWLFPLIEIANRRFWLQELNRDVYEDFRKLCFELLSEYHKYPDIAKALVRVFHHYRNLTTNETKEVLDKLFNADGFDALLVYFALYRENHFKDDKYPKEIKNYDSSYAKEKLEEVVLSEEPELLDLRSGVAWNIWKILSEDEDQFEKLSGWIDKFLTTKYNNHLFHNFERIIEDYLEKKTDRCLDWYIQIVKSATENSQETPEPGREIWLSTHAGEVLKKLAQERPQKLIEVIENLHELWFKNAYIGGISEVFSSYQYIENQDMRVQAKERFQELYNEMKEKNPKLQEVEWK